MVAIQHLGHLPLIIHSLFTPALFNQPNYNAKKAIVTFTITLCLLSNVQLNNQILLNVYLLVVECWKIIYTFYLSINRGQMKTICSMHISTSKLLRIKKLMFCYNDVTVKNKINTAYILLLLLNTCLRCSSSKYLTAVARISKNIGEKIEIINKLK